MATEVRKMWTTRTLSRIGACLLMLTSANSHTMDFSLVHRNPRSGTLDDAPYFLMKGEIRPGDYDRLLRYAVTNNISLAGGVLVLSSPGGDVTEALKIGRLVKDLYASASVGSVYGPCVSACFIIYASAVDRSAEEGYVGIHRPYISPERLRSLSPSVAEQLQTRALLDAERYLHDLRVPHNLIDEMFENASTEVHWLSSDELDHALGTRAAWYEEFLIARCGLDKEAEWHYLTDPAYKGLKSKMYAVWECGVDQTLPEATSNFAKVSAPYRIAAR